tara:strand:+ start:79 stop:381 length:303 start_codon:yes stop_codon:yes gene_type:complete
MKISYEPTNKKEIEEYLKIGDPTLMNKTVSIEHPVDDMSMPDLMDTVIMPLLLAMGYSKNTLDRIEVKEDAEYEDEYDDQYEDDEDDEDDEEEESVSLVD